jgi:hypothetical protein
MDERTFGASPAALYLAHHLKTAPKGIIRKTARALVENKSLIADVIAAHEAGTVSRKSLSKLLNIISEKNHEAGNTIKLHDPLAGDLVINILESDVKRWKNRAQDAARKQSNVARKTIPGKTVAQLPAIVIQGEKNNEQLIARSLVRLERLKKVSTLY